MARINTLVFALCFLLPASAHSQHAADWQQRVAYEMDITLYADRHQMDGFQRLTYQNNSPDTLHQVFYHLYFNAFHPNSMMAERNRHLPDPDSRVVPRIFNLGPDEIGYHRVESLTQSGAPVAFTITDTVLRADLAEPIPPGGAAVFEMHFRSQVPLQTRRSGRDNAEGIDYSMAQWYPKMAEYDSRGWHAVPYVGREFFAPFGTFDVRLTLPAAYVVGATGVLQNPDVIGHGYDGTPAGPASAGADSLTWHFYAEDVHDFAWAADPDYIHEQIEGDDGITYHLLYQPDVADRWEPMSEWVPALIQFFSRAYGPYPYPQFSVIQAADGGMEYPMVNLITGRRSPGSLLGVTAHEAAHEWFYAALATNETKYSWMDEGFTSYATTEAVAHVTGNPNPSHAGAALSVASLQQRGLFEKFDTPADWFETNTAYSIASYPGGQMIVSMLGYVMSDSLRDVWLRRYYQDFLFRHPSPLDLEKLAEDVSGLQLDWYFEQFTNSTRMLDYAVEGLDARRTGSTWTTTIELERKKSAVLPVDLLLTYEDGTTQWVNIPLGIMQGHKPVPEGWIVAEPWLWTFPDYTLTLDLPGRVVKAEIDPRGVTPDVNRLNNTNGWPLHARFLHPPQPSWFQYGLGYRPQVTYSDAYGLGVGAQVRGGYLFGKHQIQGMVTFWPETLGNDEGFDPLRDGLDYAAHYSHPIGFLGPDATGALASEKHLGIIEHRAEVSKVITRGRFADPHTHAFSVSAIYQNGLSIRAFQGIFASSVQPAWDGDDVASLRLDYGYAHGGNRIEAALELGGSLDLGDPTKASRFILRAERTQPLGALTGTARVMAGLGSAQLASQKLFVLGGASLEEQWRNDAFRSVVGALDVDARADAHLAPFSAPGPVAFLLRNAVPHSSSQVSTWGNRLFAGTAEIAYAPFSGSAFLRPLTLNAFSGVGTVRNTNFFFEENKVLADAGLGLRYDVSQLRPLARWTAQSDVLSGLHLIAKFPLWVSHPDLIERGSDPVAFRWLLGLRL